MTYKYFIYKTQDDRKVWNIFKQSMFVSSSHFTGLGISRRKIVPIFPNLAHVWPVETKLLSVKIFLRQNLLRWPPLQHSMHIYTWFKFPGILISFTGPYFCRMVSPMENSTNFLNNFIQIFPNIYSSLVWTRMWWVISIQ